MYTVETKNVSDAKWWNPFTWLESHVEFRRVWDENIQMSDMELEIWREDKYEEVGPWRSIGTYQFEFDSKNLSNMKLFYCCDDTEIVIHAKGPSLLMECNKCDHKRSGISLEDVLSN